MRKSELSVVFLIVIEQSSVEGWLRCLRVSRPGLEGTKSLPHHVAQALSYRGQYSQVPKAPVLFPCGYTINRHTIRCLKHWALTGQDSRHHLPDYLPLDYFKLLYGCWEPNPRSSSRTVALLTSDPSLYCFFFSLFFVLGDFICFCF